MWQWVWPGEADALETVPLAGRDGAGQGAPQDAVLGDDVHDLAVEADPGTLPGQRGADLDDLVAQGDDPGGVDQPLDFHAAGRGQRLRARARPGAVLPAGHHLRSRARSTADSRDGTVLIRHPAMLRCTVVVSIQNADLLAGPAGAEPELLRSDGHVPRRRDHPVDLDGIRPAHRLSHDRCRSRSWHRSGDGLQVSQEPTAPARHRRWLRAGTCRPGQAMSRDWCGRRWLYSSRHCVDRGLGCLDRGERPGVVEELDLQGLVPAFDLARWWWASRAW